MRTSPGTDQTEPALSRESDSRPLPCLIRALKKRVRMTDEIGLLDEHRIGVALPDTTSEGAWVLAHNLLKHLGEGVPYPQCQVYYYPSDTLPDERPPEGLVDTNHPREHSTSAMEPLFIQPLPGWKRGMDLVGATVGLIGLSPLLLLVGLAIKVTSPGPILFCQWRSGLGGQPFRILKFRSMAIDAEENKRQLLKLNEQDGPAFKIAQDPRITRLGQLLRTTSIDELPQLWNVLCGDMTLVGPRPLPVNETAQCRGWHRRRLDTTPGLTCIWQLDGDRNSFANWIRMDLEYIRSRSLMQDLRLILRTMVTVLFRKNAS
jgi:lipopolysaccharide/colanic/teichoic acid biosynthesis glycosyltransferase